jgi:hypothetical protein
MRKQFVTIITTTQFMTICYSLQEQGKSREQKSSSVGFPILSHSFAHGGGSPSVSGNSANPLSQPTVSELNCSIEIARSLEVKE